MKTEKEFGREFAEQNHGQEGFDGPVDIEEMLGHTSDIPEEDYLEMKRVGINNPSAREYWRGFNSFFENYPN